MFRVYRDGQYYAGHLYPHASAPSHWTPRTERARTFDSEREATRIASLFGASLEPTDHSERASLL